MKITLRSVIVGFLAFAIGSSALFGLFAPLLAVKTQFGAHIRENGFDLFALTSPYFLQDAMDVQKIKLVVSAIGLYCILQCVVASVAAAVGAVAVFFKRAEKFANVFSIVCLAMTFVYAVLGFVYLYYAMLHSLYSSDIMNRAIPLSFIPLIVCAFAFVAYVVCGRVVPEITICEKKFRCIAAAQSNEKNPRKADALAPAAAREAEEEERKIELIRQYAGLLSEGLLTQEEFDAKKGELLRGKKEEER